ncbi:MAG: hypothetical protein GXO87_13935 [Chlorobi bacterium]|nr:hypothetical protein [Chlorobiota bacterium]
MNDNIIFLTGLSLIFLHEMDAIRCKEWRIFPGLSMLDDKIGYIVFLFAHIPIFFWLFWQLTNSSDIDTFRIGFDIFLIAHLGLHLLFLKHKNNEFKDWISWTIIAGTGISGLLDLILK